MITATRHLTDRDRRICSLLAEHRVLTTTQIATVAFDSAISARHRLSALYHLRVLERFRPFRTVGTAPNHWVLDAVGAMVVAAEQGDEPESVGWRRDKVLAISSSRQLAHRIGVNSFFCNLLGAARSCPEAELRVWWPERRCVTTWGEVVRPDGYGVWVEGRAEVPFFLEYDRGTETHDRLAGKLDGYATLARASRDPFWILFVFPGPRREAGARRSLVGAPIHVATAIEDLEPHEAIWLPVGAEPPRLRLVELSAQSFARRQLR